MWGQEWNPLQEVFANCLDGKGVSHGLGGWLRWGQAVGKIKRMGRNGNGFWMWVMRERKNSRIACRVLRKHLSS